MSQSIQTPYGQFNSITQATLHIEIHHGPDFVRAHPNHGHAYDHEKQKHHRIRGHVGPNHSTRHYIYNTIIDLIGDKNNRTGSMGYKRL